MHWLRSVWECVTYRDPASGYAMLPNFRDRTMSAEFGPTVATRYPVEVKALGLLAARMSPLEFLAVVAERDRPKVRRSDRDGHAVAVAAAG
jgi:hypothetical protein